MQPISITVGDAEAQQENKKEEKERQLDDIKEVPFGGKGYVRISGDNFNVNSGMLLINKGLNNNWILIKITTSSSLLSSFLFFFCFAGWSGFWIPFTTLLLPILPTLILLSIVYVPIYYLKIEPYNHIQVEIYNNAI